MKTIFIDDFISNDPTALSVITDFTSNKLIIKGSTGIGGTSAILSITDQTVIIISPYLGMIQDKENQDPNGRNLFIYQNSKDNWNDVSDRLNENQHFILNTTPDQILKIKDMNLSLYVKIKKIPLFIDESHIAAEADYRKALAIFNHHVFNQWENYFTLSTATPVYRNIDIPDYIMEGMEEITIKKRKDAPKDITIYPHRFYQEWVLRQLAEGHKVVLFTNDENIYKNFLQFDEIKTQALVGKHLEKKVATFKDADELNLSDKLDATKDLFILSTKYITGFDIPFDASVGIISNEKSHTDNRYINDITQAYGRVRMKVINAAIFYSRIDNVSTISNATFIAGFKNALANPTLDQLTDGMVNHTLVLNEHLPSILRQQTYNSIQDFADNLKPYGFRPTIKYIDDCMVIPSGITISDMVQNLKTYDAVVLKTYADYVFININGDLEDYNGFGERLLIIYAAAFISKLCENDWLDDRIRKTKRYHELVTILKTFIDVNVATKTVDVEYENSNATGRILNLALKSQINELDSMTKFHCSDRMITTAMNGGAVCKRFKYFNNGNGTFSNAVFLINTFYAINLVAADLVDEETSQLMEINNVISEKVRGDYLAGICNVADLQMNVAIKKINAGDVSLNSMMHKRAIKTFFKHTFEKAIRSLSFNPSPEQIIGIKIKLDKNIYTLGKTKEDDSVESIGFKLNAINYSYERQKESHRLYLLGMASLHIAGYMAGFRRSIKFHREYNIVTKVPKALRYKYTPYNMVEADIKSTNAQIIDKLFNTNIGMSVYENLMTSYGISRDEAKVLYNSTLNNYKLPKSKAVDVYLKAGYPVDIANAIAERTTTSKIYFDMCKVEETIISEYRAATRVQNSIRCHDALLMLSTPYNLSNLPSSLDGVEFGIKYF